MSHFEKPFWTRLVIGVFALGTLGLLGTAIAVVERTHAGMERVASE